MVHHLVLLRKVILKIDTLFILKDNFLLLDDFLTLELILIIFIVCSKPKQRCHVDRASAPTLHVGQLNVGFHLILGLERNIALRFAFVVRANEMRFGEVLLEGRVIRVVHVFELVVAQVTRQMHPLQVVQENEVVEEVLLAEVAPGVGQDFGALFGAGVAVLNVASQLFDVVDSLLTNKDGPASEANFAECLLMHCL